MYGVRAAKRQHYWLHHIVQTYGSTSCRVCSAPSTLKDSDIKTPRLVNSRSDYADPERRPFITTGRRLKNFDVKNNPSTRPRSAILDRAKGTSFVEMVGKFGVSERYPAAAGHRENSPANSWRRCDSRVARSRSGQADRGGARQQGKVARVQYRRPSPAGHDKANGLLPIVTDDKQDLELRRQATRAWPATKGAEE